MKLETTERVQLFAVNRDVLSCLRSVLMAKLTRVKMIQRHVLDVVKVDVYLRKRTPVDGCICKKMTTSQQ